MTTPRMTHPHETSPAPAPTALDHRLRHGAPIVMGILNVTPDSFSDGGRFLDPPAAVDHARHMMAAGAEVIDVGGESTRPGAEPVPADEELRRVLPVIEALAAQGPVMVSIDTSKAAVAEQALAASAAIVNDVTALRGDPRMAEVVARTGAWVVLMHMQGTPRTMQIAPYYGDVGAEVTAWLEGAATSARARGIAADRILLDPGLGFGKTAEQNLTLLRELRRLTALGYPVLVGPSRKSFIGAVLGAEVESRLAGTLACAAWAVQQGARIVRVHDVGPTVHVIRMWHAIKNASS